MNRSPDRPVRSDYVFRLRHHADNFFTDFLVQNFLEGFIIFRLSRNILLVWNRVIHYRAYIIHPWIPIQNQQNWMHKVTHCFLRRSFPSNLISGSSFPQLRHLLDAALCVILNVSIYWYTGCPRRKGPNFGRVFLRSNYNDITQNTEILAREVWNFDSYYSLIDYQIHIETGRNMWFL